ncbi:hypothetical protein M9458_045270, partial [Cirrhinus mrigala]
ALLTILTSALSFVIRLMKSEGATTSLDLLRGRGVTFDSIVTDRHPQVQKFLREANITQYYDVSHIEK